MSAEWFSEVEDVRQINEILTNMTEAVRRENQVEEDLSLLEDESFVRYFGLNRNEFHSLFLILEEKLTIEHSKNQTWSQVRPKDLLLMCLRFMTTGCSFRVMSLKYKVDRKIICNIVLEISKIIRDYLEPSVMPIPNENMWQNISNNFYNMYGVPNCLGSIHAVTLKLTDQPPRDLFVVVDYKFHVILIDVGRYGVKKNLARAFSKSALANRFDKKELNVPASARVRGVYLPFALVAGSNFPQKDYLVNKYKNIECLNNIANEVFNYRIAEVAQIAKDAINRMSRRFNIMRKQIPVQPGLLADIIKTICCLHNFITTAPVRSEEVSSRLHTVSRQEMFQLRASLPDEETTKLRFHRFFLSDEGCVPWQWAVLKLEPN